MKAKFVLLPLVYILVSQCLAVVAIKTTALPNGVLKDSYLGVVAASGGCTPYKWNLFSGALPAGITTKVSADTKSMTLFGTPSAAANYSFTISVKGCGGYVSKASYTVVVQAAPDHVVALNWNASVTGDVAGYNVYRGPDGQSWSRVNVNLAASTQYSDSTVADRSTYYYATTAVDIKGNESTKSNIAKSVIP